MIKQQRGFIVAFALAFVIAASFTAAASAMEPVPNDEMGCAEDVHCLINGGGASGGAGAPSGTGWGVDSPVSGPTFTPGTNPSSNGGGGGGGASGGGISLQPPTLSPGPLSGICRADGTVDPMPGQEMIIDPCLNQACIWAADPYPGPTRPEPIEPPVDDIWLVRDIEEWLNRLQEQCRSADDGWNGQECCEGPPENTDPEPVPPGGGDIAPPPAPVSQRAVVANPVTNNDGSSSNTAATKRATTAASDTGTTKSTTAHTAPDRTKDSTLVPPKAKTSKSKAKAHAKPTRSSKRLANR